MYTTEKSDIAKLRAYRRELNELYAQALERKDWRRARVLADSRRRVLRAILLYEEWHPAATKIASPAEQPESLP